MVQAYIDALKNYANFSGRARRRDYWMFVLANCIVSFILGLLAYIPFIGSIISSAYSLFILVPSVAICVRRLHDIGKSGWFYLFLLIPLVGQILILVWFCTDSQADANQWGASPKYGAPAPIVEEPVAPSTIVEEPVAPSTIADESAE